MRKTTSGFTIVELLVVVVIIGILTTIGFASFSSVQSDARDSQRSSKITIISEALEKYYDNNGEYPSCTAMVQTPSTVSTVTLKGIDPNVLATPTAASGTNSISCADLTTGIDGFAYVGDGSNACLTDGVACLQYTLKYRQEGSGDIISLASRRTVSSIGSTAAPSAPTVSVTLNGGNVLATINPVTCSSGTAQYEINNRTNDGSWGSYTAWSTDTTATQVANEGTKYGYKAQARCWTTNFSYSSTVTGSESTYIQPFASIPSAPSVTVSSLDWTTTKWAWTTPTCPTGTSARYQYDYSTSYGFDFGWVTTYNNSVSFTTTAFGYTYTVQVKAQCYNNYATSVWGGIGSASYDLPVPSISAPSVTASTPNWSTTNYSWTTPTCPTGGSIRFQYDFTTSYGYDSGWIGVGGSTSAGFTTSRFDSSYTLQVQAQCYNNYVTSAWGATGSASYYRPIPTIQVLVVAGGGGGGYNNGGGGGGGGVVWHTAKSVANTSYGVVIGGGGGSRATGANSTFMDIVANGGGGGGTSQGGGLSGGSGGGGAGAPSNTGGGATTQGSSGGGSGYGFNGGDGGHRAPEGYAGGDAGGGGGGAALAGGACQQTSAPGKQNGGTGRSLSISGSSVLYAGGGGGGGSWCNCPDNTLYYGTGGGGGGGNGGSSGPSGPNPQSGAANTGSGGGGGKSSGEGGSGGSGIVIVRYNGSVMDASGGDNAYWVGSDIVRIFYGNGTFQVSG